MKRVLVLSVATVIITLGMYAQDKKPADPTVADGDKAALAVDERDMAQTQAQIQQLQAAYQTTLNHAQGLVKKIEDANPGYTLNTQTFTLTKKPEPVKEEPKKP